MWTDILHVIRSPPCPAQERISLEVLLAVVAVLGLCALGCATPAVLRKAFGSTAPRDFGLSASSGRAGPSRRAPGARRGRGVRRGERSAAPGCSFGTDGSARALWGYLSLSHQPIAPEVAAPGDVLFFDTRGTGAFADCADHAGIVESVDRGRPDHVRRSARRTDSPQLRRPDTPERAAQRAGRDRQQLPARQRRSRIRPRRATSPARCCAARCASPFPTACWQPSSWRSRQLDSGLPRGGAAIRWRGGCSVERHASTRLRSRRPVVCRRFGLHLQNAGAAGSSKKSRPNATPSPRTRRCSWTSSS